MLIPNYNKHLSQILSRKPSRLIFQRYELPQNYRDQFTSDSFHEKNNENYQNKLAELTRKIEEMDKAGKTDLAIKAEIKQAKEKIMIEIIDKTLREQNIKTIDDQGAPVQSTYLSMMADKDPRVARHAKNYFDILARNFDTHIDQAVDDYFVLKQAATRKAGGALIILPPSTSQTSPVEQSKPTPTTTPVVIPQPSSLATENSLAPTKPVDLNATNEETTRLLEVLSKKDAVKTKTAEELTALSRETKQNYHTRMEIADKLTSPEGGKIDDYDDGYRGPDDFTSITRMRLNGYLYANDIFYGGSVSGESAINEAIDEAVPLYESSMWDHILKKNDLEEGMGLRDYFSQATKFTSVDNNRVIGVIAGLLKLTDRIAINTTEYKFNDQYKVFLKSKFEHLKLIKGEDQQLEFLYSIKSFPEFIGADVDWKASFALVQDKTNPDGSGSEVIDDYHEPFEKDTNKDNKIRRTLNGYLYAAYIIGDKDQVAVDNEYHRAYMLYKDGATLGKRMDWEYLTRKSKGKDGDDGFDLELWLKEAKPYSKHDDVLGYIAGIRKMAFDRLSDDGSTSPTYSEYDKYLTKIISSLDPTQSRDAQMMTLSRIKSPDKFKQYEKDMEYKNLVNTLIEATKQHNQFKPLPGTDGILNMPPEQLNVGILKAQSQLNKVWLDNFLLKRSVQFRKDLTDKFKLLEQNNSKLAQPLYNSQELDPLDKSIRENIDSFFKVENSSKEADLESAVYKGYLKDLSTAEQDYFGLIEEVDAKLKEVDAQGKAPVKPAEAEPQPDITPTPEAGGNEPVPDEDKENPADEILANWGEAERVTPELGDYTGILIVDSSSDTDKVAARTVKGEIIRELDNRTEVTRTPKDVTIKAKSVDYLDGHLTYVRVHLNGKLAWLPEEQLYKKEDYEIPPPAPDKPSTPDQPPAPKTPDKPKENPNYAPSFYDALFDRIKRDVETTPGGVIFDLPYDGINSGCRVEKLGNNYHLKVNHPEAGSFVHIFSNLDQVRDYMEGGRIFQYMAAATLLQKRNWDTLKGGSWKPDVLKLERKGPYSAFVELDWHGGGALSKGNAEIDLDINPDGRIHYLIRAPHVGTQGEDQRGGYVSDMTQLQQMLTHCQAWSEAYHGREGSDRFQTDQAREQLYSDLMNGSTFERLYPQIGEKYYFNNFYTTGYSFMHLNWEGSTSLSDRNRAIINPVLEVKLNADNTIDWKLQNRTGANGSWVGISGRARDIAELGNRIGQVKRNPSAVMTTPAQNLPNLGGFGYNLTY